MAKEVKYKNGLFVIKLNSNKPPVFQEARGKEWILYGKKNDYPYYLINLFNRSSKHNAIVNSKAYYINDIGDDGNTVIVNAEKESLNDIIKKIRLDLEIFGGFALEVIFTKKGGKIAEVRHIDFSNVRSNADNTKFFYTKTWLNGNGSQNSNVDKEEDWEEYDAYSEDGSGKQLLYFKQYRPGLDVYPLPEYLPLCTYAELDYQIANYWRNRIQNGFKASAIINFYNGIPTDDEMRKLEERIKAKFTDTDDAGEFMLNFADSKDKGADIQQLLPPQLSDEYKVLNETIQQEIFAGHRISSPMLFGIKTPGQLGGRSEMLEANELFQNNYVTPRQNLLLQALDPIFKSFNIKNPSFKKIEPIGMFSEGDIIKVMSQDEIREKSGLDLTKPDINEQVLSQLNTVNPRVAEKIIESMTTNELRALIGLPPAQVPTATTPIVINPEVTGNPPSGSPALQSPSAAIKNQITQKLLNAFINKGKVFSKDKIKTKRPVTEEMLKDLEKSETEFMAMHSQKFDNKEKPPINIISPTTPIESPTKIHILYSYEWDEIIPSDERNTKEHPSREFCIRMMDMSNTGKLWSRSEINGISNDEGTDVWRTRGGWYTLPGTETHVPHCRHIWYQNVVTE